MAIKLDSSVLKVSLYRCRKCKVRMFERDCIGHLARHHIEADESELGRYFTVGPKNTPAMVGGHYLPLRKPKSSGK